MPDAIITKIAHVLNRITDFIIDASLHTRADERASPTERISWPPRTHTAVSARQRRILLLSARTSVSRPCRAGGAGRGKKEQDRVGKQNQEKQPANGTTRTPRANIDERAASKDAG